VSYSVAELLWSGAEILASEPVESHDEELAALIRLVSALAARGR
jgi:hypothetical protein